MLALPEMGSEGMGGVGFEVLALPEMGFEAWWRGLAKGFGAVTVGHQCCRHDCWTDALGGG